jgi:peptidoglycan biosynthesis protein MviN/MurJ (putative lipid II flippase)
VLTTGGDLTAQFLAALLILVAQSMRYLRQWKYHGRGVGRFLVNAMPVAVFVLIVASEAEAIVTHRTPD